VRGRQEATATSGDEKEFLGAMSGDADPPAARTKARDLAGATEIADG